MSKFPPNFVLNNVIAFENSFCKSPKCICRCGSSQLRLVKLCSAHLTLLDSGKGHAAPPKNPALDLSCFIGVSPLTSISSPDIGIWEAG
jgi:hypothetical protein